MYQGFDLRKQRVFLKGSFENKLNSNLPLFHTIYFQLKEGFALVYYHNIRYRKQTDSFVSRNISKFIRFFRVRHTEKEITQTD